MNKKIETLLKAANKAQSEFKIKCGIIMQEAMEHLTFEDSSAYCGMDADGTISFFFEIPAEDGNGDKLDFDDCHFVSRNVVVSVTTFFSHIPKNGKYTPNQLAAINEA